MRKRAAVVMFGIAVAAIAAAPITLHFEGDSGSAEPFLYVLPLSVAAAVGGVVTAFRSRTLIFLTLNTLAATLALVYWIVLVTYEGD